LPDQTFVPDFVVGVCAADAHDGDVRHRDREFLGGRPLAGFVELPVPI
jgi:hypothetical protein